MKAHMHFQDAAYWIAKAPPFPFTGSVEAKAEPVVLRFPTERVRQGHNGLAGGGVVIRHPASQMSRRRQRRES